YAGHRNGVVSGGAGADFGNEAIGVCEPDVGAVENKRRCVARDKNLVKDYSVAGANLQYALRVSQPGPDSDAIEGEGAAQRLVRGESTEDGAIACTHLYEGVVHGVGHPEIGAIEGQARGCAADLQRDA